MSPLVDAERNRSLYPRVHFLLLVATIVIIESGKKGPLKDRPDTVANSL